MSNKDPTASVQATKAWGMIPKKMSKKIVNWIRLRWSSDKLIVIQWEKKIPEWNANLVIHLDLNKDPTVSEKATKTWGMIPKKISKKKVNWIRVWMILWWTYC